MSNHSLQLPHQQQQPTQVTLFQPQNLSPNLVKTDPKLNASIINSPQHVMINFSENNNNFQVMRGQQFNKNNNDADNSSISNTTTTTTTTTNNNINNNSNTNKQVTKHDEVSDHIDSVINDVVNGHGSIPSNINDFEEEETNSSFKDAMFNNEDPIQHYNESESTSTNSNFGFHLNQHQQIQQQPPVKNSKKKNAKQNVSLSCEF